MAPLNRKRKPLHEVEKRDIDGSEKEGHKKMNDVLRGAASPRVTIERPKPDAD